MGKKLIPDEIREKVSVIVEKFNQQELKTKDVRYIARFQGRFLYLDRIAYGKKEPVSRMEYFREINEWEFAIFKWSTIYISVWHSYLKYLTRTLRSLLPMASTPIST